VSVEVVFETHSTNADMAEPFARQPGWEYVL
jgi:hypothetical protein